MSGPRRPAHRRTLAQKHPMPHTPKETPSMPAPRSTPLALAIGSFLGTLLLAACGGSGGDAPDSPTTGLSAAAAAREALPLGSPGYMVPTGQSSLTVALSNCRLTRGNTSVTTGDGSLTVSADGTVVFNASTTAQGPRSDLLRITLADATNRAIGAEVDTRNAGNTSVVHYLRTATATDYISAETSGDGGSNQVDVSLSGDRFQCTLPGNSFSLPDTLSPQRLNQLVSGTTSADANGLYNDDALDSTAEQLTWDSANGPRFTALDDGSYNNARFVRLTLPSVANGQTASLSVAPSTGGSYTPVTLAARTAGTGQLVASYLEEYRLSRGSARTTIEGGQRPTGGGTTFSIALTRLDDQLRPTFTLSTVSPTLYQGAAGEITGLPSAFFSSDRRIHLNNCRDAQGQAIARKIYFSLDGRILWLDGDSRVLRTLTPADTGFQTRSLLVDANGLRSEFSTYASDINQTRGFHDQQMTITVNQGSSRLNWAINNDNATTETCDTPSTVTQVAQGVALRLISTLGNGTSSTNTSSLTCPGDASATTWVTRFDGNGSFTTDTTRPGQPTVSTPWSGGTSWFTSADSNYEETYTVGSSPVSVSATLRHPATRVNAQCFSQPLLSLNSAPVRVVEFTSVP